MQKISLANVITTLLGVVLASPILGFFTVLWGKASKVDQVEDRLLLQKATIDEVVKQMASISIQTAATKDLGPPLPGDTFSPNGVSNISAQEFFDAEELIQQKIDKSVYRAGQRTGN